MGGAPFHNTRNFVPISLKQVQFIEQYAVFDTEFWSEGNKEGKRDNKGYNNYNQDISINNQLAKTALTIKIFNAFLTNY